MKLAEQLFWPFQLLLQQPFLTIPAHHTQLGQLASALEVVPPAHNSHLGRLASGPEMGLGALETLVGQPALAPEPELLEVGSLAFLGFSQTYSW